MLNLKNIKKDYFTTSETVHALKDVSIAFRKSEFVSILGPSGCGKTTMLNIIGGLDHYTDGDLIINGRSTKSYGDRDWDVYRNHRVGFIFQSYNLIPHQTVLGNVELALTIAGISKEERIERAKKALDRVGLKGQYYKRPNQLSGGQCQRVAIARALVNDPEILLADEPTGALDTVTSVQIMDLIKEISEERLVIMVTHNPELADKYSSRIVRLLDGNIIEDTAPFSEEEELAECNTIIEAEQNDAAYTEACEAESAVKKHNKTKKTSKEKARMSLFTAFKLSARNLLSKKGRTAMVGFAGSIGIIGIAVVLAFSSGIKGYIASMQDDMLSGNPIQISETAYDLEALTGMMNTSEAAKTIEKLAGRVYISSVVEYLAKMNKDINSIVTENTITEEYIEYVKNMPEEYYNALLLSYGINPAANIFADFKYTEEAESENISVKAIVDIYTAILNDTEFKDYASYISMLVPSFQQMPDNVDYIDSQYDLVGDGSKIASDIGEVMLVLNSEDELSDLLLAMLGYYNQDQFEEIIHKATSEDYDEGLYKDSFTYEELLGKEFTWYPNNTVFTKGVMGYSYNYKQSADAPFSEDGAVKLKVVGILKTKENVKYGALTSGIYYTEDLTNHMFEQNLNSDIINYIASDESKLMLEATMYRFIYNFSYTPWNTSADAEKKQSMGTVGPSVSMEDMMGGMMGGSGSNAEGIDYESLKEKLIRTLAGDDLANNILIYPLSFDEKDYVTDYLNKWNEEGDIIIGDKTLTFSERMDITYTDTLELVISMINTMIDIVSYALIAFTSISLVVSTVMIGIITYVSVVERIKEIGVIRALGGRKKDVRHLFNAETFIIGLLAGILGIVVTYIICLIVSSILAPLIGYSSIAMLPVDNAITLIIISIVLTLISGLIPASSAAKKDPVVALRTE